MKVSLTPFSNSLGFEDRELASVLGRGGAVTAALSGRAESLLPGHTGWYRRRVTEDIGGVRC